MLWMMLGVVGGFLGGLYAFLSIWGGRDEMLEKPALTLVAAVVTLGGGLVGGGYAVQWLVAKYDRRQRNKDRATKAESKAGKRKGKKKRK